MKDWMKGLLPTLSRKFDLTGSIHYALGRWAVLTRYAADGLLEADNNAAERALRAVALGRNYAQPVIMRSAFLYIRHKAHWSTEIAFERCA
jgi:transposase